MGAPLRRESTPGSAPLTQLPLAPITIEQTVADLKECLKTIKDFGETLQNSAGYLSRLEKKLKAEEQKPLNKVQHLQAGNDGNLINSKVAELRESISDAQRYHVATQGELARAAKVFKEASQNSSLNDISSPKIKTAQKLIKDIQTEFKKQEERELKSVESRLTAITGNKIFNAIFRIKRVDEQEIPKLLELAKDLGALRERSDGRHQERIDRLEVQIGRALMLGNGYRTEKQLDKFLREKHDRKIGDPEQKRLILKYIETTFPKKVASKAVKQNVANREDVAYQQLLQETSFRNEDLRHFGGLVKGLPKWREGKDPALVKAVELKLGEAILDARHYTLPRDVQLFITEATNPLSRMEREDLRLGLLYIAAKHSGKLQGFDIQARIKELEKPQREFHSEY